MRRKVLLLRWGFLLGLFAIVEVLCLTGRIDRFSMQPPHEMFIDLYRILVSGEMNATILQSLTTIVIAFSISMVFGIGFAVLIHRHKRLRSALEPFFVTYYAIPVLAFYPMMIIIFGLGPTPQILIAVMFAAIAVIVSVLDGLDRIPRVMLKVARIEGLGPMATAWQIAVPAVLPYILTGAKLAVTYSIIGIIASEFIMSGSGIGYEVSFAYTNFDNETMYPLIILILIFAITANNLLFGWERRLLAKRGMRK